MSRVESLDVPGSCASLTVPLGKPGLCRGVEVTAVPGTTNQVLMKLGRDCKSLCSKCVLPNAPQF